MKNKAFVVLKRYFDTPKKERIDKIKNSFDHVILRGEKIECWSNGKRKNNKNKRRSN